VVVCVLEMVCGMGEEIRSLVRVVGFALYIATLH
jgi:hypothetical protein